MKRLRTILIFLLLGAAANIVTCISFVECAQPGAASLLHARILADFHALVQPHISSGYMMYEDFSDGAFGISLIGTVLVNGSLYQADDERIVVRLELGWPFHCLYGETAKEKGEWADEDWLVQLPAWGIDRGSPWAPDLPLRPLWPGFIVNTVFYAALLWLLIPGLFVLRKHLRQRRGLCVKCAYDLKGAEHAVCPECGVRADY